MSTQRFCMLLTIDVRHDYFADGYARDLVFRAARETDAFLRRFGAIVRQDGHALAVGIDASQLPGLWSERMDADTPRQLRFELRCADPASAYYTVSPTSAEDAACPGTEVVSLEPASTFTGGLNPPLACVALPLVPRDVASVDAWSSAVATRYGVRFRSRSTHWKYVLTGDWHERELSIVDSRGAIAFTGFRRETLPDGQSALVARSTSAIELRERPSQRFQLHDVTSSPERVLISRLPGATPQRLWRETVEGEPTVVSEIFVHS